MNLKLKISCFLFSMLLLLTACAAQETPDPVIAFYEYARFDSLQSRFDAEELAKERVARRFVRGAEGKAYEHFVSFLDQPEHVCVLDRPSSVLCNEEAGFSVQVLGCPETLMVQYAVTNHTETAMEMPNYFCWDVQIDGNWYIIRSTEKANEAHPDEVRSSLMDPIAPGDTATQAIGCFWYGLLPGHYRLCLSHDPTQGWVVTEFDITEAELDEWEARWG